MPDDSASSSTGSGSTSSIPTAPPLQTSQSAQPGSSSSSSSSSALDASQMGPPQAPILGSAAVPMSTESAAVANMRYSSPLAKDTFPPTPTYTRLASEECFGKLDFAALCEVAKESAGDIRAILNPQERAWHLTRMHELLGKSARFSEASSNGSSMTECGHQGAKGTMMRDKILDLNLSSNDAIADNEKGYRTLGILYGDMLGWQVSSEANGRASYLTALTIATMHGLDLPPGEVFVERENTFDAARIANKFIERCGDNTNYSPKPQNEFRRDKDGLVKEHRLHVPITRLTPQRFPAGNVTKAEAAQPKPGRYK